MDLSSEYIKMCEKAEEIQRLVIPLNIRKPNYQSQCGADMSESGDWWHLNIWLPRQDELQEIIRNHKFVSDYGLVHRMNHFVYGGDGESDFTIEAQKCHTMEQLWLSFVMQSLYQKSWDKEKEQWIKKL